MLTALGIIFGVAAVIAMPRIRNGEQQEILNQIKLVGVNNIVIKPIVEQKEEKVEEKVGKKDKKKFSPGLTIRDVQGIQANIPDLERISPEIILDTYVIRNGLRRSAKLVGVEPTYFEIYDFQMQEGTMFRGEQLKTGAPICVIGHSIKTKFFPIENPIGKAIKVGPHWLTIVGVLRERAVSTSSISKLGIRDLNVVVYVLQQPSLSWPGNRHLTGGGSLRGAAQRSGEGGNKKKTHTGETE